MKNLILLLFIVSLNSFSQENTQHNEIHKALERQAETINCFSKDIRYSRENRYSVSYEGVMIPPIYRVSCDANEIPSVKISWQEIEINGNRAINYRIIVRKLNSTFNNFELILNSNLTRARIPLIENIEDYELIIEGYDSLGNSNFTGEYELQ